MFGSAVAGELTLCHVRARVENRRGTVADGWGAIFLSHYWAYPTAAVEPAAKDAAMRQIVAQLCERAPQFVGYRTPARHLPGAAGATPASRANSRQRLALPPTDLAALVCAAPLDAAIHDAFGRVNGIAAYEGYGPEHCGHDLSRYLGPSFSGRYVADYLRPHPVEAVPIAHTVGGLDRLRPGDDAPGEWARMACPRPWPAGSRATACIASRSSCAAPTWPGTSTG